jgi:hypothetical protein
MGKTFSTFLYYFLISFITSFSPKRFMQALRNSTFVWAPSVGTTELCTNFFNAQIKCFGEKDVMNEIKKHYEHKIKTVQHVKDGFATSVVGVVRPHIQ